MGALAKALLIPQDGPDKGKQFKVQFNPKELQIDKSLSWAPKNAHEDDAIQEYKEPPSSSLSFTLYFDSYETKTNLIDHLKPLESMAYMHESPDKTSRPPVVLFSWKTFQFPGVIESLSKKYTMFLEDATPVRCEVAVKMKSARGAVSNIKQDTAKSRIGNW